MVVFVWMKIAILSRGGYAMTALANEISCVVVPKKVTLNMRRSPAILEILGGTEADLSDIRKAMPGVRFEKLQQND